MLCCAVQLEAELKDLEQQSSELQVEGQHAISEYKVRPFPSTFAVHVVLQIVYCCCSCQLVATVVVSELAGHRSPPSLSCLLHHICTRQQLHSSALDLQGS